MTRCKERPTGKGGIALWSAALEEDAFLQGQRGGQLAVCIVPFCQIWALCHADDIHRHRSSLGKKSPAVEWGFWLGYLSIASQLHCIYLRQICCCQFLCWRQIFFWHCQAAVHCHIIKANVSASDNFNNSFLTETENLVRDRNSALRF